MHSSFAPLAHSAFVAQGSRPRPDPHSARPIRPRHEIQGRQGTSLPWGWPGTLSTDAVGSLSTLVRKDAASAWRTGGGGQGTETQRGFTIGRTEKIVQNNVLQVFSLCPTQTPADSSQIRIVVTKPNLFTSSNRVQPARSAFFSCCDSFFCCEFAAGTIQHWTLNNEEEEEEEHFSIALRTAVVSIVAIYNIYLFYIYIHTYLYIFDRPIDSRVATAASTMHAPTDQRRAPHAAWLCDVGASVGKKRAEKKRHCRYQKQQK